MERYREVERKFDVPEGFRLARVPTPAGLVPSPPTVLTLSSTYYDTPALALTRAGVTLRRRTGGTDDGWHLKVPAPDGARVELREPPEGEAPPDSLVGRVRVHVRGAELVPIVRLDTRRTSRLLHAAGLGSTPGADREALAEIDDDAVVAEILTDGTTVSWHEVEIELRTGGRDVLKALTAVMYDAGATTSAAPSKLVRALGDRLPAAPPERPTGRRASAGDVVLAHVREQVVALTLNDAGVRVNRPDTVHQMRVASRRLRSALRTFRHLFDRAQTDPLRDELRWLGAVLGDARDAEVMHARLRELLAPDVDQAPTARDIDDDQEATAEGIDPGRAPAVERIDPGLALTAEPTDHGLAAMAERIDRELTARYAQAHDAALRALDGDRYFRLLDALDALVTTPPLTPVADRPARDVLPGLVAKAYTALRDRHRAAAAAEGEEKELALHAVRKGAKRARYAGEALAPTFGRDAKRFAAAMESIQDVLGEHQDSAVTRTLLTDMAARAHAAGEDTFHYGRLVGLDSARAEAAQGAYEDAWQSASRRSLRDWTR